VKSINN